MPFMGENTTRALQRASSVLRMHYACFSQ
uniref:Uncharacterized protein n=1 Tax=Anguilla anguilla TaxID=7936 RepID=A0A0E9R1M5_ANGAN